MNRSMKDVEREIEESRARLDRTIDRLQDKLSVSGAVDEAIGGVRRSQYGGTVEQVLASIRNNPVPVLVALAGLGWLLRRIERESDAARRAGESRRTRPQARPAPSPSPTARDTGFLRDEDIDQDLSYPESSDLETDRATARPPDPKRPVPSRSGDI